MKGLIHRNHGSGKYNVDLSSRFEYQANQDEIDRINDRIAEINERIAEKTAEIVPIEDDLSTLRALYNIIVAYRNFKWSIGYENETLDAMPEGEERNDLEERKEALEEWVEQEGVEEALADQEAKIAEMQEELAGMEEGSPEWEALDGEINSEMNYAIDIAEPLDQIEDIDRQLEELPEGPERDEILEKIAFLEEQLEALVDDYENLKGDLGLIDDGINLIELIDTLLENGEDLRGALTVIRTKMGKLVGEREELRSGIKLLELQKAALELERNRAEERSEEEVQVMIYNIWCADLTVDLTGFIGILDVAGTPSSDTYSEDTDSDESEALEDEIDRLDEKIADTGAQIAELEDGPEKDNLRLKVTTFKLRKEKIEADRKYKKRNHSDEIDTLNINDGYNIQPGYEGAAAYDSIRDDTPTPDTYKYGIITAIDYELDTCTVNLGSSVNGL